MEKKKRRLRSASRSNAGGKREAMMGAAPPEEAAGEDEADTDDLHERESAVEEHGAVGIATEEFDDTALESVKEEIGANDLAAEGLALADDDKNGEVAALGKGFVKLGGMEFDANGCADEARGDGIEKSDAPRLGGGFAVAASGHEAAEAADGVAEGKAGGVGIEECKGGHFGAPGVNHRHGNGAEHAAVEGAPGLNDAQRENFAGIAEVIGKVERDEP